MTSAIEIQTTEYIRHTKIVVNFKGEGPLHKELAKANGSEVLVFKQDIKSGIKVFTHGPFREGVYEGFGVIEQSYAAGTLVREETNNGNTLIKSGGMCEDEDVKFHVSVHLAFEHSLPAEFRRSIAAQLVLGCLEAANLQAKIARDSLIAREQVTPVTPPTPVMVKPDPGPGQYL